MATLANLRLNPAQVVRAGGVRTGPNAGSFSGVQVGGRCQLAESVANGITTITAQENSGTDYYYPWLQRNYSYVVVPKNVHNGVIVATGGLNGCSLIVSESGANLYFYHDGDSKYLPVGSAAIQGNEIARIKPSDYDPGDVVYKSFSATLSSYSKRGLPAPSGEISYGIFVIWVKVGGNFVAVNSSVISIGTPISLPGDEIARFTP